MYGKLVNGKLVGAPSFVISEINSVKYKVYNPTAEQYASAGYLEVIEAEYPSLDEGDAVYYEKVYAERDGAIYGEWVEAKAPVSEASLEERVSDCENALIELAGIITEGV